MTCLSNEVKHIKKETLKEKKTPSKNAAVTFTTFPKPCTREHTC